MIVGINNCLHRKGAAAVSDALELLDHGLRGSFLAQRIDDDYPARPHQHQTVSQVKAYSAISGVLEPSRETALGMEIVLEIVNFDRTEEISMTGKQRVGWNLWRRDRGWAGRITLLIATGGLSLRPGIASSQTYKNKHDNWY